MADRRVKVVFEAEISKFKQGVSDAAKETEKLAKSTDEAGESTKRRMADINTVAASDQRAAKAAGLLYNAQGQLADANGKVLSSSQAAAHGVESFSEAVYLAGHDSEVAAAQSAAAAEKTKEAWKTVGNVVSIAGAGVLAGVGTAVKKYADFDKSMSSVQAATHETSGNMLELREAAITAGADTAFSAEEAAGAIEELAKAGVSTADILGGGLNGALALAAAGQLDVGEAAEYAASAMTQFQLQGKDIPHIADLLAAGAGKAQGEVRDMGLALSYAGVPAKAMGVSIEETAGSIALFASNGIIGEKAGTALRSMLVSMANPTAKTKTLMDDLGISFEDGNGKFIGLAASAQVLQDRLAGESEMARNAALAQMFGNEALGAAQALYAGGAAKVQEWTDSVNDAGYAAETAAIKQDNLAGDLEKLGGSFDTVFIKSGSGANDFLRGLVQSAESAVDAIGKIPGPILSTVTSIAGIAGATGLAVGGFIKLAPVVIDSWNAFKDLGSETSKMPGKLGKVAKAAGVAAAAIAAFQIAGEITSTKEVTSATEYAEAIKRVADAGNEAKSSDLDSVFKKWNLTAGAESDAEAVDSLSEAIGTLTNPSTGQKIKNFFNPLTSFIGATPDEITQVEGKLQDLGESLGTVVSSGGAESAAKSFALITAEFERNGKSAQDALNEMPGYSDALKDIALNAGVVVSEQDLLNWALTGTTPAAVEAAQSVQQTSDALAEVGVTAEGAVDSMSDFLDLLFQTGVLTMNSRDAAFAYEEQLRSIDDAVEEIKKGKLGKALNKNRDDFDETTEAGKRANDEFQALAKRGMDEVRAMSEEGLGQDELQAKLTTTYDDLVKAGQAFGLLPPQAKELAREVLGVPKGVDIKTWMDEVAKTTAQETTQSINEIPGYKEVMVAVSDDGTVGEVQSKVNGVTGKTEYIFVTDDGTSQVVQEAIVNIDGVERKVFVTDDGTVVGTQDDINGIKGKSVTVTVGAGGVDEVNRQLNWVARPREASVTVTTNRIEKITQQFFPGQPVSNPDNSPITGQFGKQHGGRLPRHAGGGRLPATGLGTDKILGIAPDGTPLSWVDDLEWVVNRKSSDKHDELLSMINRDDPRVDTMKKLMGLAGGGRVSWARSQRDAAKGDRDDAYAELKRARKSKDEKRKTRAQKAYDAAKAEYEDARDRVTRLAASEFDLRRDLKRGDIRESFASGNGMSIVDRMFDESNNKDLSKKQRSQLRSTAYGMESQLLKLEKQSDKLTSSLDKAVKKRDELLSAKDGVTDAITGAFDLGGLAGQTNKWGYKERVGKRGLLSYSKDLKAGAKTLKSKIEKLQKRGFTTTMLQEVIDEWTSAGTFELADAMLSMSGRESKDFIGNFKSLESLGSATGTTLTKSMHRGGIDAAEGLVKGLESKQDKVDDAFYKLGKSAESSFKKSLGIHSPSKVMFGAGSDTVTGAVLGAEDQRSTLISTFESLGNDVSDAYRPALQVPPSPEVARYAQGNAYPATPTAELVSVVKEVVGQALSGWSVEVGATNRTKAIWYQQGKQQSERVR